MPAPHKGLEGLEQTKKNLEHFGINLESCVRTACWKLGGKIMMQAKNNARSLFDHPTGRLAGSITMRSNFSQQTTGLKTPAKSEDAIGAPGGDGKDKPTVTVGTNVEYARRVEFGFVGKDKLGRQYNQAAKPYLYPSFFSLENDLEKELIDTVEKKAACRNFNQRLPIFDPEGSRD